MDLNTKPAVVLQRGSAAQQWGLASNPRQRPPLQELHFGHEWDPHEKPTPARGAKRPLERTLPGSNTASEAANAPSPTPPLVPSTLGGRQPVARRVPASAHLPMHVPAEASGQALGPQDQMALVTKAIQQDVVLLVLSVSAVVHKGHYVSLK